MPLSTFLIAAVLSAVTTAIFFAINGLLLKFVAGWLKYGDTDWSTAYRTAGFAAIASYVLSLLPAAFANFFLGVSQVTAFLLNAVFVIINAVIFIALIRKYYDEGWGRAALGWLIIFIANIIIGFLVGLLMALLATAFAFSAAQIA